MDLVVADQEQLGMLLAAAFVQPLDNFHDFGHHAGQQVQVPFLQGLAHDGVVGVGEGLSGHLGCGLEIQALQHQQADQLGDGDGGVGVVELDGGRLVEVDEVLTVGGAVDPQNILEGGAGEDILLLDPQLLALLGGVVGIEDPGDILGLVLFQQGLFIVLSVEGVEVQLLLGLALPQAQGADIVVAVADDGHIVGHGDDGLVGEGDLDGVLVAAVAPGIAVAGPVVGGLLLGAVLAEALLEEAEAVPQAVAGQGNALGDGAVQEAGGQTAQAAVAQGGVLDVLQLGQIHALFGEGLADGLENAHIEEVGVDQTAHEVLGGEVVGLAMALPRLFAVGPVLIQSHHHRLTQAVVQPLGGGGGEGLVMAQL